MHIIGILTAIAILVYWIMRAAGSARNSGVTAAWQRKKRWDYSNVNTKSEVDELKTALEAATALMIMLARDDVSGELEPQKRREIVEHISNGLGADEAVADDTIVSVSKLLKNIVQADTVILPVCKILRRDIERTDAKRLADILDQIYANCPAPAADKKQALHSYKERMGLIE